MNPIKVQQLKQTLAAWERALANYPEKTELTKADVNKLRHKIERIEALDAKIRMLIDEAEEFTF